MEGKYNKPQSEKVARASDPAEMEQFLSGLEYGPTLVGDGEIGLSKSSYAHRWFGRAPRVADLSIPDMASPAFGDILSLMGTSGEEVGPFR